MNTRPNMSSRRGAQDVPGELAMVLFASIRRFLEHLCTTALEPELQGPDQPCGAVREFKDDNLCDLGNLASSRMTRDRSRQTRSCKVILGCAMSPL